MKNFKGKNLHILLVFTTIVTVVFLSFSGCGKGPEWKAVNDQLIKEHSIEVRELGYKTETGITSNLADGKVTDMNILPEVKALG